MLVVLRKLPGAGNCSHHSSVRISFSCHTSKGLVLEAPGWSIPVIGRSVLSQMYPALLVAKGKLILFGNMIELKLSPRILPKGVHQLQKHLLEGGILYIHVYIHIYTLHTYIYTYT